MKKFLTILILMVSVSFIFGQVNYYVSTTGNDGTGDGSSGNPWATIQHAIDFAANPTTATIIINIAAGTYTEAGITIDRDEFTHFGNLSIIGAGAGSTIIQAHANANDATNRVFSISNYTGSILIEKVTIQNGNINGSGGGINFTSGQLAINKCIIKNNSAIPYGGGIYTSGHQLVVQNSTINNNTTDDYGAGLSLWGHAIITNSTIYDNYAKSNTSGSFGGGGLFMGAVGINVYVTNCTIANNTADGSGGGIDFYLGNLFIKNTIIANNSATYYADFTLWNTDNFTNNGYNIVEYASNNYSGGTGNITGEQANLNLSGTLADNSTLNGTPTLALSSGSVAIDAGNATANGVVAIPSTDQRGAARSGTVDIGAFEYEGAVPVELSSFSAKLKNENVIVNWTTATEVNNYGFEIERATSDSNWETIGFVEGHGNSNAPKEYSFIDTKVPNGVVNYRLKQLDFDGSFEYSLVDVVKNDLVKVYELNQNYPNPFNPTTEISFSLPISSEVKLTVYNLLGQQVAELVNSKMEMGIHKVEFNATSLPSGTYFYKLLATNSEQEFTSIRKLLLLK